MTDSGTSPTIPAASLRRDLDLFHGSDDVAVIDAAPVIRSRMRIGFDILCAFALFLLAAEVAARVDDRIRTRIPVLANPDRIADLVTHDAFGIRGRPHGRFKRWQLNSSGFRGPEISETPAPGSVRVMTLGASETFGLYESDNHEYPALLAAQLRSDPRYEVVNASLFGLTLPAIHHNWVKWSSRFQPRIVTIYPTPAFYLGDRAPGVPGPPPPPAKAEWKSRFGQRLEDRIEVPELLQRRRVSRALSALDAQHAPEWFFTSVPRERVDRFEQDLERLVEDIESTGASVILLTHATSFATPVRNDDVPQLNAWRQLTPRPSIHVLLEFESEARRATMRVASRNSVPVVDLAGELNGNTTWFAGDGLHFNDRGAGRVAALIAATILEQGR